jgi:hypothetical protein
MSRRLVTVVLAALALAATAAIAVAAVGGGIDRNKPTAYQRELRKQVEDPLGGPRAGRDPAIQRQVSLREAARQHVGQGARGGKPAAEVGGGHERTHPSEVLPDDAGVLASGCALGYGKGGDQCLPARSPGNKPMTCAYALELFPAGLRVTGADQLGLDTNGDGRACGHGDQGLPPEAHAHHEHP